MQTGEEYNLVVQRGPMACLLRGESFIDATPLFQIRDVPRPQQAGNV